MSRKRRTIAQTVELYAIPNHNGCTEWHGALTKDGYGLISFMENGKLRCTTAHRKIWELSNGPVPAERVVMHTCDNKACVRIDHLRLGTQLDNIHDMIAKGRDNFRGSGPSQLKRISSPKF
jgi:hypothetical protein